MYFSMKSSKKWDLLEESKKVKIAKREPSSMKLTNFYKNIR